MTLEIVGLNISSDFSIYLFYTSQNLVVVSSEYYYCWFPNWKNGLLFLLLFGKYNVFDLILYSDAMSKVSKRQQKKSRIFGVGYIMVLCNKLEIAKRWRFWLGIRRWMIHHYYIFDFMNLPSSHLLLFPHPITFIALLFSSLSLFSF